MIKLSIPWFHAGTLKLPLPASLPLVGDDVSIDPFFLMMGIAIVVGTSVAVSFARRQGLAVRDTLYLALYVVVVGLIIAYFGNGLICETDLFLEVLRDPRRFGTTWLGLSSFGGFAGAVLGAWLWHKQRKREFLPYGDAIAFGFPFAWMVARTGCFIVHDHPGMVTDFPLAVAGYRYGSPPFLPRHDLGLYGILLGAAIAVAFVVIARRPRQPGMYVALLAVIYSPPRFLLDFLRVPAEQGGAAHFGTFAASQYGAVACFVAGLIVLRRVRSCAPTPRAHRRRAERAARQASRANGARESRCLA